MSDLLLNSSFLILGFVLLYFGAEFLVAGSSKIAESFGIRKMIVGLTVVAFGTSAPELIVSAIASVQDEGDIALGNVIGSNIANIGLILGLTALIRTLSVDSRILRWEVPLMIFTSVLMYGLCIDGQLDRADGMIMLFLFAIFIWTCILQAHEKSGTMVLRQLTRPAKIKLWSLTILGAAMLFLGGWGLIESVEFFAMQFNIPPFVLSVTVIAFGTSLPELAVSMIAAIKGNTDISVGNIVGSNIFNVLLVMGVAAVIRPIPVPKNIIENSLPVMMGFAVIVFPLMLWKLNINRTKGALLFGGYVAYILYLVTTHPS